MKLTKFFNRNRLNVDGNTVVRISDSGAYMLIHKGKTNKIFKADANGSFTRKGLVNETTDTLEAGISMLYGYDYMLGRSGEELGWM